MKLQQRERGQRLSDGADDPRRPARGLGQLLGELAQDPFFAKVVESQKDWVKRVVFYELYNAADQRLAYEHFFGKLDI